MDLPDFIKESVPQIQILCTFQARGARKRAALANAGGGLDFVESVVVLLTVVQGKDGAQKCWLKNLNPKIASDLLGILGNSASCNRGVADGNHGGT